MKKATRQQIKEHNQRLVLKTVYERGDISRADLARVTGLTRTTISDIVTQLMEQGYLNEVGIGTSIGGKPPILLDLVDDARQLACVDLSGDEFRGALVNLRGKITHQVSVSIDCQEEDVALNCIFNLLDELIDVASSPVIGIGIGSPGLIDSENGVVREAVNLDWKDLPLKKIVSDRYGLPIHIANDSHIAALAEYTFGNLGRTSNLMVIKTGRGIGSGIILNGQIFYGDSFSAGEIGHLTVVENGIQCRCGKYGCLETVSSTRAILEEIRQRKSHSGVTLETLSKTYLSGDETVQEVITTAGYYLGIAVADSISVLNIENIVISGNLVSLGEPFLDIVCDQVRKRVLPKVAGETNLSFSSLGLDNVILGASALVLSKELGLN